MTNATQIIYRRQRRRAKSRMNPLGRFALGCAALVSLLITLGIFATAYFYASLTQELPSVERLPSLLEPPNGRLLIPTRLYDRNGQFVLLTLQHPAAAGWQYLHWLPGSPRETSISDKLVTATLATADPHFWNHGGAPLVGLLQGERSSLAKRLAADLLLDDEPAGLRRALRAHLLAAQITERFGREKVLEWYLNSANYGRLAYGADAAARVYFGKPASELSLAEAAMLAAASETPELNPMDAPQAALERQKRIIQDMLRHRMIQPEEGIQAARDPLVYRDPGRQGQALSILELEPGTAQAFARLALQQLETQISRSRLERGGLKVITTLDYGLQTQASCLAQVQTSRLSNAGQAAGDPPIECEAARLLPTLEDIPAAPVGVFDPDIVVLDPADGQILAMVGEPPVGPEPTALNSRPAGSLGIPFLYLTAFTRGLSPASLVWDIPAAKPEVEMQNFDGEYHGPVRLRIALANDYLVPAQKVLSQVGADNVRRTLRQFTLALPEQSREEAVSPLELLGEANLLGASQAFGVFANQGVLAGRALEAGGDQDLTGDPPPLHPMTIRQVMDLDGQVLLDWRNPQRRPIITPQLAYLMTDVLSDEAARWPSLGHPNALEVGRPAAAKLSSGAPHSSAGESHWAIGYTPQLVIGVQLGTAASDPAPDPQNHASLLQEAAAGLWHATFQFAHQGLPYQDWEPPEGISLIEVCDPSGQLPTKNCPNTVAEIFLPGNEPVQADTLYQSIPIHRETGRLATVFTPPDLVEQRIYMMVPPEAARWAQEVGLETPPQVYETIPANFAEFENAIISYPAMFALLRGRVDITGAAGGEDFQFYRIQVGKGMYPQEWLQVGQDVTQATTGRLASWDTRALNGLYTVQLLVVREDRNIERVNLLVTVDNQPPDVRIAAPVNGATILQGAAEKIILRAEAQDETGLQSLSFYLNDELLETRTQPPYAVSWSPETGQHHLRAVATDQAGNTQEDSLTFVVE